MKSPATYKEIDKKRWLVRYLILGGVGAVLAVKLYLLLFVVEFTVGLYSFFTSFLLFNILLFSYTKFKDPYIYAKSVYVSNGITYGISKPLVSIIVPVKNEEGNIRNCVGSCINSTYSNKEIIVVNDGSTDDTAAILDEMKKEEPSLNIIHLFSALAFERATCSRSTSAELKTLRPPGIFSACNLPSRSS